MNVIDVTPRPAAVSAVVRFLQSRVMTILGILFILTAFKWGTLLFVVHQYETAIITRFGKIVRTITTPGLKMKLPVIDKVQRFDKRAKIFRAGAKMRAPFFAYLSDVTLRSTLEELVAEHALLAIEALAELVTLTRP